MHSSHHRPLMLLEGRDLAVEERVNDLVVAAAGVGWRLGVTGWGA